MFPYLIDSPDEGYIDSTAWLPATDAATPAAAIDVFERRYKADSFELPWTDEGMRLEAVGREHLRAHILVFDGDDEEELFGEAAEKHVGEYGLDEDLRFQKCEPDAEGAREWWRLELKAAS